MSGAIHPTADAGRKRVGLAFKEDVRRRYIGADDLARLEAVADVSYREFSITGKTNGPVDRDAHAESELATFASDLDVLIICEGSPFVSREVLAGAKQLTLLGELDGDRFSYRLDIAAAQEQGVHVIDMSHASSYPTAEWALGLGLVGCRNAGAFFRKMIAHEPPFTVPYEKRSGPGYDAAELSGKHVGMIGFGHLARRLVELLRPFDCQIVAFDPYAPRVLAEPYGIRFAPLDTVLGSDVVFVLAPLTPTTEGMLGPRELDLLAPGSVFVNVSRGKIINADALLARLRRGDVVACLDVFDPEPVPLDSPIVDLPNVFITPHLAGVTEESRRRFFTLMVDQCLRHFEGFELDGEITTESVRLSPERNSA
jgi:D-3-phosphoglycerate dehydrogenase / 2-oxoglutarate reductase